MIRITETYEDEKTVILRLDGKITDDWVADLKKLCLRYRDEKNRAVTLDFSGVTFINDEGVKMLESMMDKQVKIINCSLFVEALLNNSTAKDNGKK